MCLIPMGIYYSYFVFMLIFILHKREGVLQFYFFPVFSIPRGIYMLCFHVDVDFIVEI